MRASPHILEIAKINGVANPVYLYAQKQFIPSLSFDETREMVERLGYFMGLEFAPDIIADLHREFGGHPFFTRQVCSKVHQLASAERPQRVSRAGLQRAKTEFSGQLESYLRDICSQLEEEYPEEYGIIKAVVNGYKDELVEFGREAPDLIDHLIGYGLVSREGEDFDIRFAAIKSALRHLVTEVSTEDRWLEISRRRNAIESEIRVALFHWSRGLGGDEWEAMLRMALTQRRIEGLSSFEPSHLFSRRESPLYLSDLLAMLKLSNVLPYIDGSRRNIVAALDSVNRLRKDAHANAVTDQDLASARAAFEVLEAEFSSP
jgi:hypothetical protein